MIQENNVGVSVNNPHVDNVDFILTNILGRTIIRAG